MIILPGNERTDSFVDHPLGVPGDLTGGQGLTPGAVRRIIMIRPTDHRLSCLYHFNKSAGSAGSVVPAKAGVPKHVARSLHHTGHW